MFCLRNMTTIIFWKCNLVYYMYFNDLEGMTLATTVYAVYFSVHFAKNKKLMKMKALFNFQSINLQQMQSLILEQ